MGKELKTLEERLRNLSYVLSYEEIDELRELCYEHSCSWCPLSDFFNDICLNDNKHYNKNQAYKDLWLIALIVFDKKKELRALEIIKEKGIILQFLKETHTVEQYNAGVLGTLVKPLTKEEYELLKEVLL